MLVEGHEQTVWSPCPPTHWLLEESKGRYLSQRVALGMECECTIFQKALGTQDVLDEF